MRLALGRNLPAKNAVGPETGAEPFTVQGFSKTEGTAGDDLLAFLLLRWTGPMRLIDLGRSALRKQRDRTRQAKAHHAELVFALDSGRDRRKPQSTDHILLNPSTGGLLTRPRLYQRMMAMSKRAGVANVHPHRFRDTLAVDMLSRGEPYDVAKMLGDTIETVDTHYPPFVKELRERVRSILETTSGLEGAVTPLCHNFRGRFSKPVKLK